MNDSFDQQAAHSPAPSPTGSRQAGQSGGSATSSDEAEAARATPCQGGKRGRRGVRWRDLAGAWRHASAAVAACLNA